MHYFKLLACLSFYLIDTADAEFDVPTAEDVMVRLPDHFRYSRHINPTPTLAALRSAAPARDQVGAYTAYLFGMANLERARYDSEPYLDKFGPFAGRPPRCVLTSFCARSAMCSRSGSVLRPA